MNLVSIPLFIQKNWLVVESDVPFWIAFNAKAPNALKDGKIMADDFIKSRGGSRFFSCTDLLSTAMKVCGYNVWLVYDADLVTENISAPTYYTCYTKPDTLQGLDGQLVEIQGAQKILDVNEVNNYERALNLAELKNDSLLKDGSIYVYRGSEMFTCAIVSATYRYENDTSYLTGHFKYIKALTAHYADGCFENEDGTIGYIHRSGTSGNKKDFYGIIGFHGTMSYTGFYRER